MSNKQLMRLAGVLVAALVLWGGFAFARHARRDRAEGFVLPKVDTAAVDTIAFHQKGDSAVLARTPQGWRVNGFPATTTTVNELLQALDDTTNWSELAAEARSAQASMGVSADSGRHVRLVVKGGKGLSLVTGHSTSDYSGMYVRPAADSAVYALHGPLAEELGRGLDGWRDKTIVSVPPDSVQRVEVVHGRDSFTLARAGKTWTVGSAAADSGAVQSLLDQLHPAMALGFATAGAADSANFTRPTARVRVFGAGKTPMADLLFDSTATNVLVRADTGATVYTMEDWNLQQMAPSRKSILASTPKPR